MKQDIPTNISSELLNALQSNSYRVSENSFFNFVTLQRIYCL